LEQAGPSPKGGGEMGRLGISIKPFHARSKDLDVYRITEIVRVDSEWLGRAGGLDVDCASRKWMLKTD